MSAWLHIIGVGEGGVHQLPTALRDKLAEATTVLGPARFIAEIEPMVRPRQRTTPLNPDVVSAAGFDAIARALAGDGPDPVTPATGGDVRALIEWESPLEAMIEQVLQRRDTPTVILASGDPMWFGIGATLARHLMATEFAVHPYPSAFQLAASRLRWPMQSITTLSLHGRPVELLHPHLMPSNRILALTSDRTTIDLVIELLVDRGYGYSYLTTLENLGSPSERVTTGQAADFLSDRIGDFYVLAIDCVPEVSAPMLPPLPGLPDDAFTSDGQLTKREVRAATLAKLAPFPGALLWDVGAGSGSVGIEWMRAMRDTKAIAFEKHNGRLQMIATNAAALGVPGLEIVAGDLPGTLDGRIPPDAVFLGGAVDDEDVFDACWQALKPGGRLVANAVTVEGEQALYERQQRLGGELARIEVSVLDQIGQHRALRPRMAVTQWDVTKALHGVAQNG